VIYGELRKRIVSLTYHPGTMIFENVVAAEFKVSRTPVRQAFFRLAREELLGDSAPARGAGFPSVDRQGEEAQAVREASRSAPSVRWRGGG